MPKKGQKLSPQKVQQHMGSHSGGIFESMMRDCFNKWDGIEDGYGQLPVVNRAEYVIINGRSAADLLTEQFDREYETKISKGKISRNQGTRHTAYAAYYREHAKDFINRMATAAIASGGKVEVFVPDKTTGAIGPTPMRVTAQGKVPSDPLARPAQLSRWQKFWGKFGFYKKERQAIKDYANQQKSWAKARFCNKVAQATLATNINRIPGYEAELEHHHPEVLREVRDLFPRAEGMLSQMPKANGFRTNRASFYTIMLNSLATKRGEGGRLLYTNEQLFDMSDAEMQKVRADALKEVYEKYKSGALLDMERAKQKKMEAEGKKYEIDPRLAEKAAQARKWLVDLSVDASDVLVERINQQARTLDFSKPDLTEQKGYQALSMLSETAFDLSQDLQDLETDLGKDGVEKLQTKIGDCSQITRQFVDSQTRQKYLLQGYGGRDAATLCDSLSVVMAAQAVQQHLGKRMKEDPGASFSKLVDLRLLGAANGIIREVNYEEGMEEERPLPELTQNCLTVAREYMGNRDAISAQIAGGVLENRFKLTELDLTGTAEESATFELQDAATTRQRLEQERHPERQRADTGIEAAGA